MKKNKLLAPFLGLATVATVIVPIATSCATTSVETAHVKTTPVVEKIAENGIAQFLLELDSYDYDKNNFTITATVSEKDKTGAKSSDFSVVSFQVDGNHLVVDVKYESEAPVEEDTKVRLNINVKYGSKWINSVEVKMDCAVAEEGYEMVYNDTLDPEHPMYITKESFDLAVGESCALSLKYTTVIEKTLRFCIRSLTKSFIMSFESVSATCNGKDLVAGTDYVIYVRDGIIGFDFTGPQAYVPKVGDKFIFKFINAQKSAEDVYGVGITG